MNITLSELRQATSALLQQLEEGGYSSVDLDVDYYWSIPKKQLYNPYQKPEQDDLTLGQAIEDWKEIKRIANGERDAIPYHLVWLAEVIKAVGHSDLSNY